MALLYVVGSDYNLLGRGPSAVVVSDADALYPLANLYDGLPGYIFKFGSNGADRQITKNLNAVTNGDFETSTLASWIDRSTGTGSKAETSVGAEVHSGAKAAKLGGGASGSGIITQDIAARAGERRTSAPWLRGDGTASIRYRIQNLKTGLYLQAGGASWGAAADLFTRSTASYLQSTVAYQIESWNACQASSVTLRLTAYCNENGFGFIDDIVDFPTWNFCGVFGHAISPVVAVQLRSSTDGFSANDVLEATLTPYQPSFYGYLSTAAAKQHVRLKLSGTNDATPWAGEVVVAYVENAATGQAAALGFMDGMTLDFDDPRLQSAGGEYAYALAQAPRIGFGLPFEHIGSAEWTAIKQEIYFRSRGGAQPVVIVPVSGDPEVALGRIESPWSPSRDFATVRHSQMRLVPFPMPSIVT